MCCIRYCILCRLYSILYMYILSYLCYVFDSKFYILYMLHILTSILLVPSVCTIFNILLLVFYLLWSKSYMLYSIMYLVSTISISYTMYILYIYYVLDSKFYILYMLHFYTLSSEPGTTFNILLLVSYLSCPKSYTLYSIMYDDACFYYYKK